MGQEIEKIIYDGDPGHDDIMAIIMAAGNPTIDLLGVTTVAGNSTLANSTKNALMVMDLMNHDAPVIPGCDRPLIKDFFPAPMVHGLSGLDGVEPFEPNRQASHGHASDFIIHTVMESNDDINIVTAGPMTNLALAMIREPKIVDKIKRIVFMGGGRHGNITGAAEFNIWADAEAAKVVIESSVPKVMCGLDLTTQARATGDIFAEFKKIDSDLGRFVYDFMLFYAKSPTARGESGPAVHDACCIAYLIDNEVFTTEDYRVEVETKGEYTYGMTVIDVHRMNIWEEQKKPNVRVALKLDFDRFWEIMLSSLRSFS